MDGLTEVKKVSHDDDVHVGGEGHYPWGTSLRFENEMIDDLNLAGCKVGDEVKIVAVATVESISESTHESENNSHSERSVGVQLTAIKVSKDGDKKSREDTLYSDES